ncbi:hypothetical protein [Wenyingzhuangia aestuarii]|uniref:hypothetical protein n=1 Tax=Wenyingzhuangia aestuarii TaxID=1647582 RepID=UPI001AD978CE|nr:hypothetical protein [Wenyingzhuangia aestuarii]NJB82658.1 hypothetical protein [Wenyingzhuangia aestuarii]
MIKNYTNSSFEEKKMTNSNNPNTETISFLLAYSKSVSLQKSKLVKTIRFDKN